MPPLPSLSLSLHTHTPNTTTQQNTHPHLASSLPLLSPHHHSAFLVVAGGKARRQARAPCRRRLRPLLSPPPPPPPRPDPTRRAHAYPPPPPERNTARARARILLKGFPFFLSFRADARVKSSSTHSEPRAHANEPAIFASLLRARAPACLSLSSSSSPFRFFVRFFPRITHLAKYENIPSRLAVSLPLAPPVPPPPPAALFLSLFRIKAAGCLSCLLTTLACSPNLATPSLSLACSADRRVSCAPRALSLVDLRETTGCLSHTPLPL